jgi:hypothetical protein
MLLSVVTNACALDHLRLEHTIPHYLRVFGRHLGELVVVVDSTPATGRIASLHSNRGDLAAVQRTLSRLAQIDHRVRVTRLPDPIESPQLFRRWFRNGDPVRCQAGTPIYAFVHAISIASHRYVLRCDCDMLFCELGWVTYGMELLGRRETQLIGVPRLSNAFPNLISTRGLLLDRQVLYDEVLPIPAYTLALPRRLKRWIERRPPYLALEQMLDKHAARSQLHYTLLSEERGFSVHAGAMADFADERIVDIIHSIECGHVPPGQANHWDLSRTAWAES